MGDRNCLPQVLLYGRALVAVVSRSIRTAADIAGSAILYGEWRRGVSATMRQTHAGGEKLFVGFAVPVIDPLTVTHSKLTFLLPRLAPPIDARE
jgi:hypothetical protein